MSENVFQFECPQCHKKGEIHSDDFKSGDVLCVCIPCATKAVVLKFGEALVEPICNIVAKLREKK